MAHSIAYILLLGVVVTAAITDVRTGLVPNWLTYSAIVLGLLYWTLAGVIPPLAASAELAGASDGAWRAMLGFTAALLPTAAIFFSGGLGGGDVKLMTAVGTLSGDWRVVLAVAVYALLVAAAMSVVVMVRQGIVKQTLGRIANVLLMASARVKPSLPTDSPRIPFAVAICVGSVVAGAEHLLGVQYPWTAWGP